MILGTVQLGLNYGINNNSGKPSMEQSYEILDYAYNNGIRILDTASAYGNSEEVIGNYTVKSGNYFKICTKLPTDIGEKNISELVESGLNKLKTNSLHTLYLHRFEQCKNKSIVAQLDDLKSKDVIDKVGVSIYEPSELDYILKELSEIIDVVQIPFNIFDCYRWINGGLLTKACKKLNIFARSIYLQGLILAGGGSQHKYIQADSDLLWLNELSEKKNSPAAELAMSFVKNEPGITDFLVGCESLEQLKENISISKKEIVFSREERNAILTHSKNINETVIDPRKWNLKPQTRNNKVIAIIQARMTSSRLPKKVLTEICGKPMLWHIVKRVSSSSSVNDVIVATSDEAEDNEIENFAKIYDIPCFRGSKLNVLERFWKCANQYSPDIIVRLTGDNALVDPQIIDEALKMFIGKGDLDYLYYREGLPVGMAVEIIKFSALTTAYKEATNSECLEHVTPYLYRNGDMFLWERAKNTGEDHSSYRWTMDTPEDKKLILAIYDNLYEKNSIFHYDDILREYAKHKEWHHMNNSVVQKKVKYSGEKTRQTIRVN